MQCPGHAPVGTQNPFYFTIVLFFASVRKMKGGQGPIFHLAFAGRAWYDRPVKPASRKKREGAPAMTKAEARAKARALGSTADGPSTMPR